MDVRLMNWLDFIIIGAILLFGLIGHQKGLVLQIAGIVTMVGGIVVGWLLCPIIAVVFSPIIDDPQVARTISFFLLFSAVAGLVGFLTAKFQDAIKSWDVERSDQTLGLIFGVVNAVALSVILCTGYAIVTKADPAYPDSFTGRLCHGIGRIFVPKSNDAKVRRRIKDQKNPLKRNIRKDGPSPSKPKPTAPARPPQSDTPRPSDIRKKPLPPDA
jgi:membrane protein required for colicin V production